MAAHLCWNGVRTSVVSIAEVHSLVSLSPMLQCPVSACHALPSLDLLVCLARAVIVTPTVVTLLRLPELEGASCHDGHFPNLFVLCF